MLLSEIISPRKEIKETQLNEALPLILPALALAARVGVPAIARVLGKGAVGAAKVAVKNPKTAAVTAAAATNPDAVIDVANVVKKTYNLVSDPGAAATAMAQGVWDNAADAAKGIAEIVGNKLTPEVINSLAAAAVKYALPAAAVVAILYGGKKLYDYMSDSNKKVKENRFVRSIQGGLDSGANWQDTMGFGTNSFDNEANVAIQLLKNLDLHGKSLIKFQDGSMLNVNSEGSRVVLRALDNLKPKDRHVMTKKISKSKEDFKEFFNQIIKNTKQNSKDGIEEGWKSKLAGAAMMGLGALGATSGQADAADYRSGAKATTQTTQAAQNITKVKRYPTDPRQELTLGSPADLFFNGDEHARKMRYLDYQTNPDFDPKTTPPSQAKMQGTNKPYVDQGQQLTPDQKAARDKLPLRSANWHPDDDKPKEDAAGVGIITKQNTTGDVNKGSIRKNLKAFKL